MHRTLLLLALLLAACPGSGTLDDDDATGDDDDSTVDRPCGDGIELTDARVLTTSGVVEGNMVAGGRSWLGIPYVQPPVGDLRFAPPTEVQCADELLVGDQFGPVCPQLDDGDAIGDEDCLQLNVWAPDGAVNAPVLVFVHGGGNTQGSTTVGGDTYQLYGGGELMDRYGAVVVTLNYRLGALGFLAHEALSAEQGQSGNYGLMDQQAALRWVQENIGAFGGDPSRVLLFGESAGAVNTCSHIASPGSAGLFSSAVMQSGGCGATAEADALDAGAEDVDELGCSDAEDVLTCLRGLGASALVGLNESVASGGVVTGGGFGPVIDGLVLDDEPWEVIAAGDHNAVPFVVGSNAHETAIWTPVGTPTAAQYPQWVEAVFGQLSDAVIAQYPIADYPSARWAWIAITSDVQFICPARWIAQSMADAQTEPVWSYHFTRRPPGVAGELNGAWHGLELAYVFNKLDPIVAETGFAAEQADYDLEDAMGAFWTNLATTGDVNGAGGADWPEYDLVGDRTMELGATISPVDGVRAEACDFWLGLFGG